ncbi:hypothetical protein NLG97_g2548 [Lecanicillium saksenae]|uniref:Uncharacterized protein n=1 Tax=Lecanicillium saksenae TaxID=468837 RepID=A0ACC1R0P2_9HYPO|nr:hypothetical protein NLG97_g2548 [Lecanicillium saksenae]
MKLDFIMEDTRFPVPSSIFRYKLLSGGGTGYVFELADGIVLKYGLRGTMEDFMAENAIYDLFETKTPPVTIIQSFLRLPGLNFMPQMAGSLEDRMLANRDRDEAENRCRKVRRLEPATKVAQWAAEMTDAIAWLASIGLAHGDIRPDNMLLCPADHLKLPDFDRVVPMGSKHLGGIAPWVRSHYCLGQCPPGCPGGSEKYSTLTEQFTPQSMVLVENLQFPPLGDSPLERPAVKCWMGKFSSLEELAQESAQLEGAGEAANGTMFDAEYMDKARERCRIPVKEDLADLVPHPEAAEAQIPTDELS